MTDFDPGPSSIRDRDIDPKSVNAERIGYEPAGITANTALLNDGYVVSSTGEVGDPDNSSNATQDVIDNSPSDADIYLPARDVPFGSAISPNSKQSLFGPGTRLIATADVDCLNLDNVQAGAEYRIKGIDMNQHNGRGVYADNTSKYWLARLGYIQNVGDRAAFGDTEQDAVEIGETWGFDFQVGFILKVDGRGIYHNGNGGNDQRIRATVSQTGGRGVDLSNQAGLNNKTDVHVYRAGDPDGDGNFETSVRGVQFGSPGIHRCKSEKTGGVGIWIQGATAHYPYLSVNNYGQAESSEGIFVNGKSTAGAMRETADASATVSDGIQINDNFMAAMVTVQNGINVSGGEFTYWDASTGRLRTKSDPAPGGVGIGSHFETNLGGAPDATNYQKGDTVHDTGNDGDVYLVYDNSTSGGVTQIGT